VPLDDLKPGEVLLPQLTAPVHMRDVVIVRGVGRVGCMIPVKPAPVCKDDAVPVYFCWKPAGALIMSGQPDMVSTLAAARAAAAAAETEAARAPTAGTTVHHDPTSTGHGMNFQ